MYFITDNQGDTYFGITLRHCAFKWQQSAKKRNSKLAGLPVDWAIAILATYGYNAGKVDFN